MPSERTVDFGENLTDQELFDDATTKEPAPAPEPTPEPEPAPETPEPVETTGGRLKDPVTGKFVAKADKADKSDELSASEQTEAEPETEPEPEAEPQMPASVPSWRLAEEAQRRREAEAQNYAAQQQLRQMQQQMAQYQEHLQKQQQEPIDPVSQPEQYQHQIQQALQREISNIRLESNLQIAQFKHGDTFDKAYEAFYNQSASGDKATYDSVMGSPNPGEAIVRWYTQRETMNRIGGDPDKWLQSERDKWMSDPAVQAEVIKRFQAQNGTAPSNQQVKIPPSLSRAPSAASAAEGNIDTSDAALFEYATAKR